MEKSPNPQTITQTTTPTKIEMTAAVNNTRWSLSWTTDNWNPL